MKKSQLVRYLKEDLEGQEYEILLRQILSRLDQLVSASDERKQTTRVVDKLDDLDVSLDYIASALTGKRAFDIDLDQDVFGRVQSVPKNKVKENKKGTKIKLVHLIKEVLQERQSIEEGYIKPTPEELRQIDELLPAIIDGLKLNIKNKVIGKIQYVMADDTPAEATIIAGWSADSSGAYFETSDKNNPNDNIIFLNRTYWVKNFNILGQAIDKLAGSNFAKKLRSVIIHELIHAKDPAVNHKWDTKANLAYKTDSAKSYYGNKVEFVTFTGQLYQLIGDRANEIITKLSDYKYEWITIEWIKEINLMYDVLNDLLRLFAGYDIKDPTRILDWFGSKKNSFQKVFAKFIHITNIANLGYDQQDYMFKDLFVRLKLVKQHNPEGYKKFQREVYKLVDSLKDRVKEEVVGKHSTRLSQGDKVAQSILNRLPKNSIPNSVK